MTDPQDPFAPPSGGQPIPPQGYGSPTYGAPEYGAPPPPYGEPYGQPYGATHDYASWGARVAGALIDGVIVLVPQLVLGAISQPLGQVVGIAIVLYLLYLAGTKGQSPGKSVMKIKLVRDADGRYLGFGLAVVRYVAHFLDALTLGIGYLWPLWDKKKQTFADKVMGSVVVKA